MFAAAVKLHYFFTVANLKLFIANYAFFYLVFTTIELVGFLR